ncbi:hypothetical protein [Pseudonocardia sp. HH130630-07]|uniref:hypothetical protein n=1 Tax=Pseudonocardia sp. HH130630-07 TaxID=1690815 RepID=UPI0008151CB0|nr:hypothetical protein [Pseudonocardia sp. HH130630-07]ANY06215.1 hypothetical protein AFB00_07790 [Pseudonocardia sp. HH130630-07]
MTPEVLATGPGWTERAAALVRAARPGPAGNRLVTVDGFSGAGKSTLAAELSRELAAPLLEAEDLCPGWSGLERVPELARRGIGDPLAAGETLRWTAWDWAGDGWGPVRERAPAGIVVLEGCGSGAGPMHPVTSLAFWVDVPAAVREQRLRDRADWPLYRPYRETWRRAEAALAATGRARERAGVLLVPA